MTPRLASYRGLSLGEIRQLAYWGPREGERTPVRAHGPARQGRDFEVLETTAACNGCRLIYSDLVGRGQSAWLAPELTPAVSAAGHPLLHQEKIS